MLRKTAVLALIVLIVLFESSGRCALGNSITSCDRTGPCKCETNDKKIVDLSPLDTGSPPQYSDVGKDGHKYEWQPCSPFICGKTYNAAVCQVVEEDAKTKFIDIGDQSSEKFAVHPMRGLYVEYTTNQKSLARSTRVYLKCDPKQSEPRIKSQGRISPKKFEFVITSSQACPGAGEGGGGGGSGGGGGGRPDDDPDDKPAGSNAGTILVICFSVGILVYFGVGILLKIFWLKKSGVEVVPNHTFWMALPGLIKDGFFLAFRPCQKRKQPYAEMQ